MPLNTATEKIQCWKTAHQSLGGLSGESSLPLCPTLPQERRKLWEGRKPLAEHTAARLQMQPVPQVPIQTIVTVSPKFILWEFKKPTLTTKGGSTFAILFLFTIHMFIYLCRQGCPFLAQIKWKNGRSKAISWGTLPVFKWTICCKVWKSSVLGAMRQLHSIQPCFGKLLCVDVSELNPERAPASASSATHRCSSARGSLCLVGTRGLAEWGWKWALRTPRTGWGKPLPKASWMYCEKGDEKLKVKTGN